MDNTELAPIDFPDHVTVEYQNPPVKDQLISAAVSIGAALAVPVVIYGSITIYDGVKNWNSRRKDRKAMKTYDVPVESPTETD